jgi:hypothetical protein
VTPAKGIERHVQVCLKNPKNWSCRDTESTGVEITRNQRGLGVRHQQRGADRDDEAVDGEGTQWKHVAFEGVDWEVACRYI